jgi:hypothetical protein
MHDWAITLLEILIPVLASVLTALSAVALKKLQQKFNVELSVNENEMVKGLIRDGIASAEEWGARKANLEKGATIAGREKAKRVIGVVKAVYPKLQENEIAMLIDAEIARSEGLGSTNKRIDV